MTGTGFLAAAYLRTQNNGTNAPQDPDCVPAITRYDTHMDEDKHTKRLTVALVALVAVLLLVAVNQFVETGAKEQQAAVLRVYAE